MTATTATASGVMMSDPSSPETKPTHTPLCDALRALFIALGRYGVKPPVILVDRVDWNIINAALEEEVRRLGIPLVQETSKHRLTLQFMSISIVHRFDNRQGEADHTR